MISFWIQLCCPIYFFRETLQPTNTYPPPRFLNIIFFLRHIALTWRSSGKSLNVMCKGSVSPKNWLLNRSLIRMSNNWCHAL